MKAKEEFKEGDKIKFRHEYPARYLTATIIKVYDKKLYNMYLCRTKHYNICLREEEMTKVRRKKK